MARAVQPVLDVMIMTSGRQSSFLEVEGLLRDAS